MVTEQFQGCRIGGKMTKVIGSQKRDHVFYFGLKCQVSLLMYTPSKNADCKSA